MTLLAAEVAAIVDAAGTDAGADAAVAATGALVVAAADAASPPPNCTKPLNKIASPLICGACNNAAFTSMLNIVPPAVDPISTAAG